MRQTVRSEEIVVKDRQKRENKKKTTRRLNFTTSGYHARYLTSLNSQHIMEVQTWSKDGPSLSFSLDSLKPLTSRHGRHYAPYPRQKEASGELWLGRRWGRAGGRPRGGRGAAGGGARPPRGGRGAETGD